LGRVRHFQPDYDDKVRRREFIRNLHNKIRQPVLPGKEQDYLVTQAFAEYLAAVHIPRFDGVIFGSAQHKSGRNVVLFQHVVENATSEQSTCNHLLLDHCPDQTLVHKITSVEYKEIGIRAQGQAAVCVFTLGLISALDTSEGI
jgi:hypothetical protein